MTPYNEQELADLLRALPPAPEAWVAEAQDRPRMLRQLDAVLTRAEEDRAFSRALIEDLEQALRQTGYDPTPALLAALRERIATDER
jgi:hypothetical protein